MESFKDSLNERDLDQVIFDFKTERNAKQFAKDIENASVGLANDGVVREKGKYRVVVTEFKGSSAMHKRAIGKYAKENKGVFSHSTSDKTPAGYGPRGESVELDEADVKAKEWIIVDKKTGEVVLGPDSVDAVEKQAEKEYGKKWNSGKYTLTHNKEKLKVGDVDKYFKKRAESVELDEGRMKEFWQDIHDELENAMDKKWYREMQSSNGAQGLDNIISNTHKQLYAKGDPDPKDIADAIVAKYGRNHKEYIKLSMEMMRRNESVELDEGLTLASDTVNDVKKSAQKLARSYPDRTYYVVQNKDHHGGWSRYEVVDSVDMHMFRDAKKIIGYGKSVKESVELDEVYYRPGERIKYLHKQWNYAMKQIEHSVKVMEKEYSRPSPDWDAIHQEMYNITAYQLQNIKDFIPQKGYKGPLQGSPVDIVDSVEYTEDTPEESIKETPKESAMDSYVSYLSKDKITQPNKSARLSLDARNEDV